MAGGLGDIREDSIELDLQPALTSNRVTVFFRLIMVIPHFLALGLYGIAAFFVAIFAWFAALFTGEVPAGLFDTLADYVGYQARVIGYLYFLTDRYPPFFKGRGDDYPITIRVSRGRLNRLAVLFRVVLVIPAVIVSQVLTYGMFNALGFVLWLLTVIMGRVPGPMYGAYAVGIRYLTRVNGYFLMVTATYPWGVLGDRSDPAASPALGFGAPADPAPAPNFGTPVVFGVPAAQPEAGEQSVPDARPASPVPASDTRRSVVSASVGDEGAVDRGESSMPAPPEPAGETPNMSGPGAEAIDSPAVKDAGASDAQPAATADPAAPREQTDGAAAASGTGDAAAGMPPADPWASAPPPPAVAASPPPLPVPPPPPVDGTGDAQPVEAATAFGLPAAPPLPPAGYLPPAGWQAPDPALDHGPAAYTRTPRWSWALDQATKTLIVVMLILGTAYLLLGGRAFEPSRFQALGATSAVQVAQANLATATRSYETTVSACNGQLSCVTAADAALATAVHQWSVAISDVGVPASVIPAKAQAVAAHNAFAADLVQLSQATDVSTYQSLTTSLGVVQAGNDVDQSTVDLLTALRAAGG